MKNNNIVREILNKILNIIKEKYKYSYNTYIIL